MSQYVLERSQIVPGDLESVFTFFESPRNLKEITPPWLSFQVVWASDEKVKHGTKIRYRIKWLGLSMRWESLIAEYEQNERFADEMLRGPFKSWYHTHLFEPVPEGVEISDRVEYSLPFGPLGRLAHWLVVRHQLQAIFNYREKRIVELLGTVN